MVHRIRGIMKLLVVIVFLSIIRSSYEEEAQASTCKIITGKRTGKVRFLCRELTSLEKLDRARKNTTDIAITDSNIPIVPSHTFARFGATLEGLDLHSSGILTIEPQAFIGLTKLQRLILWDNKLRWVSSAWFINTYNLRILDVSFNSIEQIDYPVYQMLPYLETFNFDYNQLRAIDFGMFGYLGNLKRVKFGRNPFNWAYRARLTWQLENQHVTYTEEWEDWAWMNVAIKKCIETGKGEIPNDSVLDCLVEKLLDFTYESVKDELGVQLSCNNEARRLVTCMRPKNGTKNTDSETMRMILEDYVAVLPRMSKAQSFSSVF